MKHRMLMVVLALAATLALAAPVGAASPNSQGAAHASAVAWSNWASFDGGMAPGLVPAQDPAADEDNGDDGTGAEDDQGDDSTGAEDDQGDQGTDEATGDESAGRPQNHGWFVQLCAHDPAYVGREHGKHVKDCAHSQDGKPPKGGEGDTSGGDTGAGG